MVVIQHISSIVTEGIRTIYLFIYFCTSFKKKKNPTSNQPKKEFSTLNNQLNAKKLSGEGERRVEVVKDL